MLPAPSAACGTLRVRKRGGEVVSNDKYGPGKLELLGATLSTVGCIIMLVPLIIIGCVLIWFIITS